MILKEYIHYDPATGIFTWLQGPRKGKTAGWKNRQGYIEISLKNLGIKQMQAHRLAYIYMDKLLPEMVDHINRIKDDNRWCNLRDSNRSLNGMNKGAQINNTTGYKGVSYNKYHKKYMAHLGCFIEGKKKKLHLGYFATKEEAYIRYLEEVLKRYGPEYI